MYERERELLYQTLELLRKTTQYRFDTRQEADNYIFSILPYTKEEILSIYYGKNAELYFNGEMLYRFSPLVKNVDWDLSTRAYYALIREGYGEITVDELHNILMDNPQVIKNIQGVGAKTFHEIFMAVHRYGGYEDVSC